VLSFGVCSGTKPVVGLVRARHTRRALLLSSRMSLAQEKRWLPKGGVWFPTLSQMLAHAKRTAEADPVARARMLCVGWDRRNAKGVCVKCYACYETPERYFASLDQRHVTERNGYELTRQDAPTNLYLDVEWIGEPDSQHEVVAKICESILHKVNHKRTGEVREDLLFVVSCSSCAAEGRTKNSYRITCPDIVFANNHDGSAQQFVASLGLAADVAENVDPTVCASVPVLAIACGACPRASV
jgi:hypothetical protein